MVPFHSFNIKDCDAVDNNAHYRVIALYVLKMTPKLEWPSHLPVKPYTVTQCIAHYYILS